MTLHDWYAGMALMGLMADATNLNDAKRNAVAAHTLADAMLDERRAWVP